MALALGGADWEGMEGLALRVEDLEGESVVERVRVPEGERDRVKEGERVRAGEVVRVPVPPALPLRVPEGDLDRVKAGEVVGERLAEGMGGAEGGPGRGSSLRILLFSLSATNSTPLLSTAMPLV